MIKRQLVSTVILVISLGLGLCLSSLAAAKDFPVQARLFIGATQTTPTEVNTELTSQSFKKIDSVPQYGVEMTYPILKLLDVGIRYTKRYENPTEPTGTTYTSTLDQDCVQLVVRVPIIKTRIFRVDAFAGGGGTNTSFSIKSASDDGEVDRKASGDWYSALISSYGASVAVGYKRFFLVFEGGYESNKIGSLKSSGTLSNTINTMDLSGSYFTVGLLFDGVMAHSE